MGVTQFVVHEAFDITSCFDGSSASSLTPSTMLTSGSFIGALTMTYFAPASRCLAAASRERNTPVDSSTTSTPKSPHGRAAGSLSANTRESVAVYIEIALDVRHTPAEPTVHRIVLEEVGERIGVRQIVNSDDVEPGATGLGGAEEIPPDPPEAVDRYLHVVGLPSLVLSANNTRVRRPSRRQVAVAYVDLEWPPLSQHRGHCFGDGHRPMMPPVHPIPIVR